MEGRHPKAYIIVSVNILLIKTFRIDATECGFSWRDQENAPLCLFALVPTGSFIPNSVLCAPAPITQVIMLSLQIPLHILCGPSSFVCALCHCRKSILRLHSVMCCVGCVLLSCQAPPQQPILSISVLLGRIPIAPKVPESSVVVAEPGGSPTCFSRLSMLNSWFV